MKILIISDTHRNLARMGEIMAAAEDVDRIVHLGDMSADARELSRLTKREIISVNGNCDSDFSDENYKFLETECGRILLLHGHREHVKSGLLRLCSRAVELACTAVFFGHTHVACVRKQNGVTLVNPGSPTYPAGGANPSYAIAYTQTSGLSVSIVYIDPGDALPRKRIRKKTKIITKDVTV
ncbi:MAG: metallophosphoesterase [Clostridiales Family XIII bacterium]|jgi:putative phosphoesterase|nr:metallophosphoesterase [Clostridiales Family XIII bacterium]